MTLQSKTPCYFGVTQEPNVYQASFEITNICNMNCAHCCNRSSCVSHGGLPINDIKDLIDDLYSIHTKSFYITGGEPTLYPKFAEVIEYINSKGLQTIIATNGFNLEPYIDSIDRFVSKEVGVFISLDGIDKVHDDFRGKRGSFVKAIESIRLLSKRGIPVRISTVLWKGNIKQIEELIYLAKTNGAYQIHFTILVNAGRAKENDIDIPFESYTQLIIQLQDLSNKYSNEKFIVTMRRNTTMDETCENCQAGLKIIHINSEGVLFPCSWIAKSQLKDDFAIRWRKGNISQCIEKLNSFQKVVNKRKDIYGNSGCPAMAILDGNDILSEDPLNKLLS